MDSDLTARPPESSWRDFLGIVASIACAIHCAAMPFIIGFLPMLGLSFLADESFHKWMAGVCILIAVAAFIPGWRKHRRWLPGTLAVCGLAIITSAAYGLSGECCEVCEAPVNGSNFVESTEPAVDCCTDGCCSSEVTSEEESNDLIMTVSAASFGGFLTAYAGLWTPLGGLLIVGGHLLNRHFICRCGCCP
ncbi:MerC domain-containing protein [Bremerella alba]|uniref:MerC domain-containing protein n=1 Tax=Bremerella alba TaxID=980252 RepID=A0A7V8VA06_9BACT|nr:MerC domain-containing protein [Bremerella alba]MBA2117688.1 hypothetical protein [Bremerella alba]